MRSAQQIATQPRPVVSVIVTVRDGVKRLKKTLDSLAPHADEAVECILVDDACAPRTARLCRRSARKTAGVHLVRHRVADGPLACRNAGLRASSGACVVFLEAGQALPRRPLADRARACIAAAAADARIAGDLAGQGKAGGRGFGPLRRLILRSDLLRATGGWSQTCDPCRHLRAAGYRLTGTEAVLPDRLAPRPAPVAVTPAPVDLLFVPHKDYHVWTIVLLRDAMRAQGLDWGIVDISAQWRDDGVRRMAGANDLDLVTLDALALGRIAPRLIVVFNDWDPITRPIVLAARAAGLATAGIVEGIQDYDDADVGWSREAYRAVDTVLLPGAFDEGYFRTRGRPQTAVPVGVARIAALRRQPIPPDRAAAQRGRVLINSNFAYGVLVDQRDIWLTTAVQAVLAAGMVPVISRHPADHGTLFAEYVTDLDFYACVETCAATIQRFASGVIEALAREVPVLYFRPRGEKVDKYTADPMGVYPVCTTQEDLVRALRDLPAWQAAVTARAGAFLDLHAGPRDGDVPATTVTALAQARGAVPDAAGLRDFVDLMRGIDRITLALTQPGSKENALFGTLARGPAGLAACRAVAAEEPSPPPRAGGVLARASQRLSALFRS